MKLPPNLLLEFNLVVMFWSSQEVCDKRDTPLIARAQDEIANLKVLVCLNKI